MLLGGYAHRKEINEQLRVGSEYDSSRGYRLGLIAIAASSRQASLRVLQKVSYFFALETDGVLWNLKGLAQPPPAICFAVLGLMYMPRTCPLASLFLLLAGHLVLVAVVFIGDPRYHSALILLALILSAKGFIEDWPVLWKALKTKEPTALRRLLAWGAIMLVFLGAMAANVCVWILARNIRLLKPEMPATSTPVSTTTGRICRPLIVALESQAT